MAIEARLAGPLLVPLAPVARDRHHGDRLESGLAAQPARDLVAVDSRESDVQQDHVGPVLAREVEAGRAVVRHGDVVAHDLEHHLQADRRVLVVVDDQHPDRGAGTLWRRKRRMWLGGSRGEQGEAHDELTALTEPRAPRLHAPPVELDQPANEREPDAEPALRAVVRVRALHEEVEDPRQQIGPDADAGVGDAEQDGVARSFGRDVDAATGLGVLDGVGEQVDEDLLEPHRVALQVERLRGQCDRQAVLPRHERGAAGVDGLLDHAL